MNHKPEPPPPDTLLDTHQKRVTMASDAILRRWVTWFGVVGTVVLGAFFFGFMIYQTIRGESEPANWLIKLTQTNYAALVGVPMSAVTAFCIVSLLKVTNGPIEFEVLGFKFRGASGPIVLWVLCFLAIVVAFRVLWPMAPNHARGCVISRVRK
jgi:magnesium-transporting ATPase (P-type)